MEKFLWAPKFLKLVVLKMNMFSCGVVATSDLLENGKDDLFRRFFIKLDYDFLPQRSCEFIFGEKLKVIDSFSQRRFHSFGEDWVLSANFLGDGICGEVFVVSEEGDFVERKAMHRKKRF